MQYAIRQLNTIRDIFKNKADIKASIAICLFLAANTLKIVLFNYCMIPKQNIWVFQYKLTMTILLFIIIYPVFFTLRKRVVFLTIYIFQTVYILVNISYYMYFHSYLHLMQWFTLFSEAFAATGHSATPKNTQLLIAFIDLPVFIYVFINYFNVLDLRKKLHSVRIIVLIISIVAIIGIEINNLYFGNFILNYLQSRFDGESKVVERYGTVINNIAGICLNRSDKDMIEQFKYGIEKSGDKEFETKPNFVVIQVESMDANVINQKYKGEYIAPFMHSLSENYVYYPYVLSYHMGGGTSDSEFSIINSIEPIGGYPAIKIANYDYPNSFIKALSNDSYSTLAFHGNIGSFFNRDVAFPKMGFQEFDDMTKMNLKHAGWGAPDSDVFNYALNKLNSQKQPFFSYIISMTSHGPFTNANNYYNNKRYSNIKNDTVESYFNSMSYVDQSIKDFVTKIRSDFKNTYIFIWGDHTPLIEEDEYQQASITLDSRYLEFVPLMIITPEGKQYREDKEIASFLDISPTILNASGIKYNIKSNGQDLLSSDKRIVGVPFKEGVFDRESLFKQIDSKTGNASLK